MLADMSLGQFGMAVLIIGICCLLILVVLVQKGRGGGLAGAFGGAGGSSAFGAKTGDVFTWITVAVAAVFLLLSVVGGFVFDQSPDRRGAAAVAASGDSSETSEGKPSTESQEPGAPPIKIERLNIETPEDDKTDKKPDQKAGEPSDSPIVKAPQDKPGETPKTPENDQAEGGKSSDTPGEQDNSKQEPQKPEEP